LFYYSMWFFGIFGGLDIPLFKKTQSKIKSIACTKSLSLLEKAYERQKVPAKPCADNISIERMQDFARSLAITSVPALIMPDGRVHMGYAPAARLIQIIDGGQ